MVFCVYFTVPVFLSSYSWYFGSHFAFLLSANRDLFNTLLLYWHFCLHSKTTYDNLWIFRVIIKNLNQETLCFLKITMICRTLASLWKSLYSQRPVYNPLEHLRWSFYCENIKPLSIKKQKSSIVDACMGSKYTSAFWRLFKCFIFLKDLSL